MNAPIRGYSDNLSLSLSIEERLLRGRSLFQAGNHRGCIGRGELMVSVGRGCSVGGEPPWSPTEAVFSWGTIRHRQRSPGSDCFARILFPRTESALLSEPVLLKASPDDSVRE